MSITPTTRPRIVLLGLLLGGLALAGSGCTARTVPLPPPTVDSVSAVSAQGLVVVRGFAEESAQVAVLNEESQSGVIVSTRESGCGSTCPFTAEVPAAAGDSLRLWQFKDTENPVMAEVPR